MTRHPAPLAIPAGLLLACLALRGCGREEFRLSTESACIDVQSRCIFYVDLSDKVSLPV